MVSTSLLHLHPLAEIVPRMPADQWRAFVADIATRGVVSALQLSPDGRTVVDGRHRLLAAQELGLKTLPVEQARLGELSEEEWMVRAALLRRHLSDDQRAVLAARFADRLSQERQGERATTAAQARWSPDAWGSVVTPKHEGEGERPRSREWAAEAFGVPTRKVRTAAALQVVDPTLGERVLAGEMRLKEAEKAWQRQHNLKALADAPQPAPGELGRILCGDFRQLGAQIADESVDLVFTDPPYMESALPLWRELASLGRRVLKPGGFLITYTGHLCLPQVCEALGSELDYYWLAIIPFRGQRPSVHVRQVRSGYRGVLIYVKEPIANRPWFSDVVEADRKGDKRFHDWGQSVGPARYFVSHFSAPGELVLDPFCGAGAFPVAAVLEGRRALGMELDPDHAEVAAKRVGLAEQEYRRKRDGDPLQKPFGAGEGDGTEQ
ncbi:MAG TPA: DNA methyltransferase [Candidatus Nanopelagicaceae bacterium]|nr:DNA methyltransferase [Candidatus Nanopelagicaceae bacterium]HVB76420.1 DNA methyltransferase [Candidatus Nitrosotalea sp.]